MTLGLIGHETECMFTRCALNDVPALERAVKKLAALDAPTEDDCPFRDPFSDKYSDK